MARRLGLIAALTALAAAPPAHAAPAYPLYGVGAQLLRPGVLASEGDIHTMPVRLAAHPGGAVAFAVETSVYTLRGARLVRVPAPSDQSPALAYAPDGGLLLATCPEEGAGQVLRATPDRAPVLVAGRPGRPGNAGDGGPGRAAAFRCLTGIDVDAEGGILVADPAAGRVRRIDPDGTARTVAGSGPPPDEATRPAGDGGPATAAVLARAYDVAAVPGGGFAVLDGEKVRLVGADGVISATTLPPATAIASSPDGLLILETAGKVWRRSPSGALSLVTDLSHEAAGISRFIPVANDPFGSDEIFADDVVAAPDGGVLLSADFAIHYVPPAAPRRLALAIRPETRKPAPSLTVSVSTTAPAQLRIGVWRRGKRAALVTTNVPGGDAAIPVPGLRPGLYSLHIQAADHDEIAAASADVLVGGRLPLAYARGFIRGRLDLFEIYGDAEHVNLSCRRMGDDRVDCAMRTRRGACAGIVSLRVEADGSLSAWQYDGGRRCRFDRDAGEPTRRGPRTLTF